MESKENNSNSGLKTTIVILAALLVGSLGYIYKLTSDANVVKNELVTTKSDKESVMSDLTKLKATYDTAIAEKTTMSDELIAERDKVVDLINNLKKSKGDAASMSKYKAQYFALETKMKGMIVENEGLKLKNTRLTTQRDSTVVVLTESKKVNENLSGQNQELSKTVEKAAKLTVLNLKTTAFKIKNSGKQIETDKASRADMLKVSFTIAENQVAKAGDKQYYVQVIDSKNNVLGDKKIETFGDNSLTYSFTSNVKFENETVQVSENLAGKDFEKGTYFVNVFDKDTLVSKTSFALR